MESQAALRHKVSALMRAGDTEYLAEQMPELQARTAEADKEYRRCLEALPAEERAASERKLKKLLALDEEAARKEDVVKVPSNHTWPAEMLTSELGSEQHAGRFRTRLRQQSRRRWPSKPRCA